MGGLIIRYQCAPHNAVSPVVETVFNDRIRFPINECGGPSKYAVYYKIEAFRCLLYQTFVVENVAKFYTSV